MRICAALIERARYDQRIEHPIHIAYDEWNVWYRDASQADAQAVEERYDLSDALAVATYLNGFIRHCGGPDRQPRPDGQRDRADLHQPDGLFLQTIYHRVTVRSTPSTVKRSK